MKVSLVYEYGDDRGWRCIHLIAEGRTCDGMEKERVKLLE